ncbi:MAG: hypothetical protein F4045_12430 [Chloroflexi bacterium]|nr:hypothetical protein [Chloroflexota bacterium]
MELLRQAEVEEEQCLVEGHAQLCSEKIIGAHYVQEARLSQIATDGKVMVFAKDVRKFRTKVYSPELRATSNRMLKPKMVCNEHDLNVFKPIENADIDSSNRHHCLLLAYRSVLAYMYHKRMMARWLSKIVSHDRAAGISSDYMGLQSRISAFTQEEHEARMVKTDIENKIFNNAPDDWEHLEIGLNVPASVAGIGFLSRGEPPLTVIRDPNLLLRLGGFPQGQMYTPAFEEEELLLIRARGLGESPRLFHIVFSVFPQNGMQKVIVSYPERARDYAGIVVSAIEAQPEEQTAHLSRLLLDETELLMVSPAQWTAFSDDKRTQIKDYYMNTITGDGKLIEDPSGIDLWATA